MNKNIDWYFYVPILSDDIKQFEKTFDLKLSDDFKQMILKYNGAEPVPDRIKIGNGDVSNVNSFVSFLAQPTGYDNNADNEDEDDFTIYDIMPYFIETYEKKIIPFAFDSVGNYYCIKNDDVVYWTQDEEIISVCPLKDFINNIFG